MQATTRNAPVLTAWGSAVSGILGLLMFPLFIFLTIMEPSNEYPEPLHTITHNGPIVFFPGGLLLAIVAIVLVIMLMTRYQLSGAVKVLTYIGLITGIIAVYLTLLPAIGIVVSLFRR